MKTYQGTLKELGQAEVDARKKTITYTYIEIGDQMIKKITTFNGLDGKLNNALGKHLVLHINGNALVAVTTEDGKTYATEKWGMFHTMLVWGLLIWGVGLAIAMHVLVGLPLLLFGGYALYKITQINSGSKLPNAILIPR